ncbi:energy transducer TonB [Craterilacuibacter sp.]|uniref:energy transducer TonB n=1 Tax=Craterilacuibacter sp. TaxID=2870909 RepID=UPI003F41073A
MLKTAGLPQALTLSLLLHLAVLLCLPARTGLPFSAAVPGPLRLNIPPPVAVAALPPAPSSVVTAKAPAAPLLAPSPEPAPLMAEPDSVAANTAPVVLADEEAATSAPDAVAMPVSTLAEVADEAESLGWEVYLPARLLDGPSLPLEEILLPEPDEAEPDQGVVAEAEIKVYVNEQGEVDAVEVVRAEPPGVLDDIARAAFIAARFAPGMQHGRPVRHYKRIVINRVL